MIAKAHIKQGYTELLKNRSSEESCKGAPSPQQGLLDSLGEQCEKTLAHGLLSCQHVEQQGTAPQCNWQKNEKNDNLQCLEMYLGT